MHNLCDERILKIIMATALKRLEAFIQLCPACTVGVPHDEHSKTAVERDDATL